MKPWRTGVCRVTGDVTQKSLCGRVSPQRIVHTTNVTYGHAHVTQRSKSLSSDMYNSSKQIKQEVVQRSLCRAQEDTNLGTTLPNTNTCVRFQLEDPSTILSLFPKLTSCWRPGLYGTGKSTSEILRGKPKQNTLMISWSESVKLILIWKSQLTVSSLNSVNKRVFVTNKNKNVKNNNNIS